ncbi:MAG TPA: MBL fold metallo-hydrolase [Candidatus Paceibacterota bacterium]|jgi:beta-lactamase superfamily II metal-dependent hydrolase|nr:MBL fold metallo-hydrolase [Candidatus Paceibacterota bacterium]
MTVKSRTLLILVAVLVGLVGLCFALSPQSSDDGKAHVFMLDIGQGDSFLVVAPDHKKLLIDGGRDTTVLSELSKVLAPGDNTIDVMIATHPDADHIGGLQYVLDRYHVGLFLTSEVQTDTKTFTALYKELLKEHVTSYYARRGMIITLDSVHKTTFTILFPDRDTTNWITNPASVVGRLDVYADTNQNEYTSNLSPFGVPPAIKSESSSLLSNNEETSGIGGTKKVPGTVSNNLTTNSEKPSGVRGMRSMLFTGDSTSSVEHFLVGADPQDLRADVLKLGHHGSKYSSSTEYLTAVHPVLGLISAGINNRYGHPNIDTLARLKSLGIPWISTQQKSTVELTTDGAHQWTWKSI